MNGKQFLCTMLGVTICLGTSACNREETDPVSVQSVALIAEMASAANTERFSGVVEAGETVNVEKDDQLQVKEILVSAGDRVEAGQALFSYDTETLTLDLERLSLELEQLKATAETKKRQMEELEKEKSKAAAEEQLSYTLQIQELQIDLAESDLNIAAKEKEIKRVEGYLESEQVLAPVAGRVKYINENEETDDMGRPKPFISILKTETFRVKGNINEMNAAELSEGTPVTIRSRMDDGIWTGTVERVDWDNPVKNESYYYYGEISNEMMSSSKYPFYVTLDDDEGLKLGQHIFIESGLPTASEERLMLPAWCLCDAKTDSPWVWSVSSQEKLEKRSVKLGKYDAATDCYEVLSGLNLQDYVSAPDDACKDGASVVYYSEKDFQAAGRSAESGEKRSADADYTSENSADLEQGETDSAGGNEE